MFTSSALPASQLIADAQLRLDPGQRANAITILNEFAKAGYHTHIGMAAVANAWAESRLGVHNVGDNGNSLGLFQLNMVKGAGVGMTRAQALDPVQNTLRIIEEVRRIGGRVVATTNPRAAARYFCIDIERPDKADARAVEREGLMMQLFPTYGARSAAEIPPIAVSGGHGRKLAIAGVLSALLVGAVTLSKLGSK